MNNQPDQSERKTKFNALFWSLQIGGWGLFTLLNLAGRQYFVHFHFSELVNSLVLGICLLISTSALRKFYQYKLKPENLLVGFLQMILGSMIASVITTLLFSIIIFTNKAAIFKGSNELLLQQILLGSPMIMFLILVWSLIYLMFKKQQQLKRVQQEQDALEQSLKAARLEILLSQLNPHFIFNAINNIRALILEDSNSARDMLADLSEVMRYTMQIDKDKLILFRDEIEVVKQFIALNKLQFEDKLQVQFDLADKTLNYSLPPMVLQLLIENALKHGIGKLKQGGKVVITSLLNENHWAITVENSGVLLFDSAESKESSGVGIKNIKQRLVLVYGEQASFSLEPSPLGVIATIKLPL